METKKEIYLSEKEILSLFFRPIPQDGGLEDFMVTLASSLSHMLNDIHNWNWFQCLIMDEPMYTGIKWIEHNILFRFHFGLFYNHWFSAFDNHLYY